MKSQKDLDFWGEKFTNKPIWRKIPSIHYELVEKIVHESFYSYDFFNELGDLVFLFL